MQAEEVNDEKKLKNKGSRMLESIRDQKLQDRYSLVGNYENINTFGSGLNIRNSRTYRGNTFNQTLPCENKTVNIT